ncbi:Signal transduction histidine kinase [Flexibacter flexilis DSM 6793]|uniref:histidine kinase n=1 Tax=Flexibacter flexilis DSM 6793 TaxID=927664 RepID=A0A1I1HZS8_9BACT|nr:tetratricopeptide repeat protein [Flexibacter flexilis]SFC27468.1 Signal transduction histidine kinase [Flexibacter flexilis DSM 6793]
MSRLLLSCCLVLWPLVELLALSPDSLLRILPEQSDTAKIYTLNQLAKAYKSDSVTRSLEYAQKALLLAEELADTNGLIASHNSIGEYYLEKGEYAKAQTSFAQSLFLSKKIHDIFLQAVAKAKLGVVCYYNNQYPQAFDYQMSALRIFRNNGALAQQAECMSALGYILDKQGYQEKALHYYWDALRLRQKVGQPNDIAKSLNAIGDFHYFHKEYAEALRYYIQSYNLSKTADNAKGVAIALNNMGMVYIEQGRYDEAVSHLFESLSKKKKIGNKKEIAITLTNIAQLYARQKKYPESHEYFRQALTLQEFLSDKSSLLRTYKLLGKVYLENKEYEQAIISFQRALDLAQTLHSAAYKQETYELMGEVYLAQDKAQEFLKYYKLAQQFHDSLQNEAQLVRIHEMQIEYEREESREKIRVLRKEQETQRIALENEKTTKRALFVGVVLASVLMGLIYMFYRLKIDATQKLELQNELILRQNTELNAANQELQSLNKNLQESEVALRRSNDTKNKFFSIISHDLRGPLATLSSFLSLLIRFNDKLTKEELAVLAADIEKSLKNVSMLLDNLLQWSQAQMNVIAFRPEPLSLAEKVSETLSLLTANAQRKNIMLTAGEMGNCTVLADKGMFDFVLRNLISNAIKFTPPSGHIKVELRTSTSFAFISVADTGVGLSDQQYERLFNLTRISTIGTQGETGTGLGLILCKEFVEKHGGHIEVKRLTVGTVFTFSIPLATTVVI